MHAEFRSAVRTEPEQIGRLMAAVVATSVSHDEAVRTDTIANVNSNLAFWLDHPEKCVHIVATVAGKIVGGVLVEDFLDPFSFFVFPHHQPGGIGRALVNGAIDACRGRSPKQGLWLNAATNAVGFYERIGFETRQSRQVLPAGFVPMRLAL